MEYLTSLKPEKSKQIEASMYSIRNDFQIIIKNSSSFLPELINRMLIQTDYIEVMENQKFPHLILQNVNTPKENSELAKEAKKVPAIIKYTAFSIDSVEYSKENIIMLETIKDCKNNKIFECFFIKEYIDYNWSKVIHWVITFSILQILTIFSFIVVLGGKSLWYLYLPFLLVYLMLFIWDIIQVISAGPKSYFKNKWNWVDSFTPVVIIYWLLSNFFNFSTEYESYIIATMLMIRGLNAFKAVSGTRYYVRLIMASLNDIRYFLFVFFYSTLFFSIIITIAQDDDFSFETIWNQSWRLNFGGEVDMDKGNTILLYITVIIARIVNVILMLNMLISILGDSYDNFLLERHIIDYREKLESVIEIQKKMMFFKKAIPKKQYFHFIVATYEDSQNIGDWQGKILYMEKRQEIKMQRLSDENAEIQKNIIGIENKIAGVEKKIENKIVGVEKKIENKIAGVEKKIENKIAGVEDEIQDIKIALNKMSFNMEKILEIVSKNKN